MYPLLHCTFFPLWLPSLLSICPMLLKFPSAFYFLYFIFGGLSPNCPGAAPASTAGAEWRWADLCHSALMAGHRVQMLLLSLPLLPSPVSNALPSSWVWSPAQPRESSTSGCRRLHWITQLLLTCCQSSLQQLLLPGLAFSWPKICGEGRNKALSSPPTPL